MKVGHRPPTVALVLPALLFLAACGDGYPDVIGGPWPRDPGPRTDSAAYQLVAEGNELRTTLRVSFTNPLPVPLYYARCLGSDTRPMFDVRRAGPDSLTPLDLGLTWGCTGGVPTGTIRPGGSLDFAIDLSTMTSPDGPTVEERSGSMRLVVAFCDSYRSDSGDCSPASDELRASNVFTLVPPAPASAPRR